MREKIKGVVAFFVVGLLIIPLALFGIEGFFSGGGHTYDVADVNGQIITEIDLSRAISGEQQRLRNQFGDNLPAEFSSEERLRQPVLNSLIGRALLADVAIKGGMTFSDEEIDKIIVARPEFQEDGVFDQHLFMQFIGSIGESTASFRQAFKEDISVGQLQNAIVGTDFVTENEVINSVRLSRQTRDFSWLTLPLDGLPETMPLTVAEITTHYEDNKADYLSEELVSVEYIQLDVADLMQDIAIDEADIRAQYEQTLRNLESEAEREAAHILIEGDNEAAQQKIVEVQEKLDAGEDFATLAAEYSDDFGSKDNGGNLGISAGGGFPEDFEEALKTLTEGEVSGPVEISGSTHFIKLVSLTQKEPPKYEEQKATIELELKRIEAENQFIVDTQALEELAYNAESLAEVAEDMGLPLLKSELFTRQGGDSEITRDSRVRNAAFSQDVLEEGLSSPIIGLSEGRIVVLKLIEHQPVRTLSLDEKRDDIESELKLEKAKAQLAERAVEIRKALDEGQTLAAVGEAQELSISSQVEAGRNAADVPRELLQTIFEVTSPKSGEVRIIEEYLENGDYVIAELSKVTDGTMDQLTEVENTNLRGSIASNLATDGFRAWQVKLEENASIERFQDPIEDL